MKRIFFDKIAPLIVIVGICYLILALPFSCIKKNAEKSVEKYKLETEKIKGLVVKDLACIREKLFIKEGRNLIEQDQSCDLYNGDIYLRERNGLTKLGIEN